MQDKPQQDATFPRPPLDASGCQPEHEEQTTLQTNFLKNKKIGPNVVDNNKLQGIVADTPAAELL